MSVRIVRLGEARAPGEGLRLGTVRFPPRGVAKAALAAEDYYDVWYPDLAPSAETIKLGRAAASAPESSWKRFERRYRAEMMAPHARHALELLAALSHTADFSVGCYCAEESRCHRSILRALLAERGARIEG
jgi:uncharacterized protein YeaO (DUF488 family)